MRFSELEGARVGVWGLGAETRAFVAQARVHLPRARIAVVVREDPADDAGELRDAGALIVDAGEAVAALRDCDVLVRSPGVSIHRPELVALAQAGVPAITPTGLWLAERGGRHVIGVTGTKGKSTTATVIAHLATAAGLRVHLAGNIGRPAIELLDAPAGEWAVIELSSYQTADLIIGPQVAVVTNLYPEHVDWHGSQAAYRADKLRLLGLPGVEAWVLPAGDAEIDAAAGDGARVLRFGVPDGWHVQGNGIHDGRELRIAWAQLPLRGAHNALNVCAALTAMQAAGLPPPELPEGLAGLRALPHRLEVVCDADGVQWVDDSISTTPESTIAALASFPDQMVILLGGGSEREQDYAELGRVAAARGAVVLGLPLTGARLVAAARSAGLPAERAFEIGDMAEAVGAARRLAQPGGVVLMSPAAPSYNAYRNFEERGDHFAALARDGGTTV